MKRPRKRIFLFLILVGLICVFVVTVAHAELRHKRDFGHFAPYGLHVDVVSREVSIGIPGQKMMYSAELSNFSLLPVTLDGCDYVTDDLSRGTAYPYAVQRWESAENTWKTIVEPNRDDFCHPVPLSTVQTNSVSRRLWPGMQVQVMDGEATGAREPFQKGDQARFVIFKSLGEKVDWQNTVASAPFVIEDDVPSENGTFRVKH